MAIPVMRRTPESLLEEGGSDWEDTARQDALSSVASSVISFLSVKDLFCYLSGTGGLEEDGDKHKRKVPPSPSASSDHSRYFGFKARRTGRRAGSFGSESAGSAGPKPCSSPDEAGGPSFARPPPPEATPQRARSLLGQLVLTALDLSLHPLVAAGSLADSILALLDRVSLLGFLKWGWRRAGAAAGAIWRFTTLPFVIGKSAASYVIGAVQVLLNVAADLWLELRGLGIKELLTVVLCLLRGESLPPALQQPCGVGGNGGGLAASGSGLHGFGSGLHLASRSSSASGRESVLPLVAAAFGAGGTSEADANDAFRQARAAELRQRLDRINRTAQLVAYHERPARAMPRSAAERVKRMMHYDISLRPFQATVMVGGGDSPSDSGEDDYDFDLEGRRRAAEGPVPPAGLGPRYGPPPPSTTPRGASMLPLQPMPPPPPPMEPFMCTPQSFPPTPISRACVMARRSQFADDILFLVRDQLRLDEHSRCPDETTRVTAEFLRRQARLAVLNGHDAAEGIALTCGQHCATKVGSALYSSVRAMVPVLRNRFVFFQFSVTVREAAIPSLSLGLSTLEMPLNNPVGAWAYSIGLASTGQVLLSSRWYGRPGDFCFGVGSTVGVLVYLDGAQVFQSWDGDMVRAHVTFSVDGRPVQVAMPNATTAAPVAHPLAAAAPGGSGVGAPGLAAAAAANATAGTARPAAPGPTAVALALPRDRDLFPTITLHSPQTQVFCRFCAADMLPFGRAGMGALPDVAVYGLDGSLILGPGDP